MGFFPNERLDTNDARAIEAFGLNDWRFFLSGVMTETSKILTGFDIVNFSTIFSVSGLTLKVDNVVFFHPESTTQASGFYVFAGTEPDESVTLSPSATNFVELDLEVDSATPDVRAFWDQAANGNEGAEFSDTVETVINLQVKITSNISGFTTGKVPLYKVVTNASNVATSIKDSRPLFFRLGTGGTSPDPDANFAFPALPDATHSRLETPITATSATATNAPWQGGDKNFKTFKDWMDVVMTLFKEITGQPYWYMQGTNGGIAGAYQNAALTVFVSGIWEHSASNAGELDLTGGSTGKRLGLSNDITLLTFSAMDLTTDPVLYIIVPSTDTAVTYGFGDDAATPVVPKDVTAVSATSITVTTGGNYEAGGGNVMVRGQEFAYTSYTDGSGLFAGVTPDPSGLSQIGDDVYALDISGVGYYHLSASSKVPGISGTVSEGAERVYWLAIFDGVNVIQLRNGDLEQGERIEVSDNTSLNVLTYMGSTGEADETPDYLNADSPTVPNIAVADDDDLTTAIKKLDKTQQGFNTKLIRGGEWSWTQGSGELAFVADAFVQIPGLTEARNTVQQSSESPITLSSDGDIAFVDVNRDTGGAVNLTVSTGTISGTSLNANRVVIARRIGGDVLVGEDTLLKDGESSEIGRGGTPLEVQDETVSLSSNVIKINFEGTGVTATEPTTDEILVTIPGGGSVEVEDEGTPLTSAVIKLNFIGLGVTATEPTTDEIDVTIPGAVFDPSSLIESLEESDNQESIIPKRPNETLDTFRSDLGTKVNLTSSDSELVIDAGQTSGTYERTREVTSTLTTAQGVVRARLQALAPKNTALTPSDTSDPVTMVFNGDVTDLIPVGKNILLAHKLTSDGTTVNKFLVDGANKITRLNVSAASYSAGPDETDVDIDNSEGLDLSLGIAFADFNAELRLIPFDYQVQTSSKDNATFQSAPGMELVDIMTIDQIGISGENVLSIISDSLTGSILRSDFGASPNRQYQVIKVLENNPSAGTKTYHWYHSKNFGATFTHFSTTKTTNNTFSNFGVEEQAGNFALNPNGSVVVADTGKMFSIYSHDKTGGIVNIRGVFSDLSIGSPTLSNTPATGSDATFNDDEGATAGTILSDGSFNFFGIVNGDTADLSWIMVSGLRGDNPGGVAFFNNGGATFEGFGTGINAIERTRPRGIAITGTGSSHRGILIYQSLTSNDLKYEWFDQGTLAPIGSATINSDSINIVDIGSLNDRVHILYENNSNEPRFATGLFSGTPSITDNSLDPSVSEFGSIDRFNGFDTSSGIAWFKSLKNRIVINPSDDKHVFLTFDHDYFGNTNSTLFEIRDSTDFIGSQISQLVSNNTQSLRAVAIAEKVSQSFDASGTRVKTVAFRVHITGDVPFNGQQISCELQTATAGVPSGSTLVAANNTIDVDRITKDTNGQLIFFNFPETVLASGEHAFVISADTSVDVSNFITFHTSSSSSFAGGELATFNGSTWSVSGTADLFFHIYGEWITDVGRALDESRNQIEIDHQDQESCISLIDSGNLLHATRRCPVNANVYRPEAGHLFARTVAIGSGTAQSVIGDSGIIGYLLADFDENMIFCTSMGNDECARLNVLTGAIDATNKSEDRSGLAIVQNNAFGSVPANVSDSNFQDGVAVQFVDPISNALTWTFDSASGELFNINSKIPFAIELEIKLDSISVGQQDIFGMFNSIAGQRGWRISISSSGFLSFEATTTGSSVSQLRASDTTETLAYHKIRVTWDGTTGKLFRSLSAPFTTFVEVGSYSLQNALFTTSTDSNLIVGGMANTSNFLDGKVGYVKYIKGSTTFAYDGWKNQAPLVNVRNEGKTVFAERKIGENDNTSGTVAFEQPVIINAVANEQAVVDSNDLYLMYNEALAAASQGDQINTKLTLGRASDRNISSFMGTIMRFLKN